jgi:hypothetical protein
MSLKLALERLLAAPCYHMVEVFARSDYQAWTDAAHGKVDWHRLLDGYAAAVDWPAAAFWVEISTAFPDAVVLLSTRRTAEEWWASASATIFEQSRQPAPEMRAMLDAVVRDRLAADPHDRDAMTAAYERHNASVRATAPRERFVDWQPGDGWAPLAAALGVPVPAEPFPHVNTTEEFRARVGRGGPPGRT